MKTTLLVIGVLLLGSGSFAAPQYYGNSPASTQGNPAPAPVSAAPQIQPSTSGTTGSSGPQYAAQQSTSVSGTGAASSSAGSSGGTQSIGIQGAYGSGSGGSPSGGSSSSSSGGAVDQSISQQPADSGSQSGGSGGSLQTECKKTQVAPGQYKFICDGVNKDLITSRSQHILWLTSDAGKSQVLDVEIPNYKLEELIKAGYKPSTGGDTKINVLLKKPEQTYDAEVDVPKTIPGDTKVNLKYEPVENKLVHFPNDKAYRPLSGPILPPLAGNTATATSTSAGSGPGSYSGSDTRQRRNYEKSANSII